MHWILSASLAFTGAVMIALAIPLVRRRIPPNPWYGVRFPSTLADERVWYAVNERSGRDLIVFGAMLLLLAVLSPIAISRMPPVTWPVPAVDAVVLTTVVLTGVVVIVVRAVRHAARVR